MGLSLIQIFGLRLLDHFWWLLGAAFMVEPWFDAHVERYRDWAEKYVSRQLRARLAWSISFVCLFIASAWAFSDEFWNHQGTLRALYASQWSEKFAQQKISDLDVEVHDDRTRIEKLTSDLTAAQNKPPKIVYVQPPRVATPLADSAQEGDPDAIYQLSKPVGTVIGAHVLLTQGLVTFEEIDGANDLNINSPFEYRNFVLQILRIETAIGSLATMQGSKSGVMQNVSCKILKR